MENKEQTTIEEIRHGIKQLANCEDGSFAQADWLTTLDIKLDELKEQAQKDKEQTFRNFWNFITGRKPFEDNYKQEVTITFADIEKFIEQFKESV